MNEIEIELVKDLLSEPKKIVIIPHRSPDGDAMGSTLALHHFLRKIGQQSQVIAPNEFPHFLDWLPGADHVLVFEKEREKTTEILKSADLIFVLDFNALHRTGDMEQVLNKLSVPFIMIDHH